MAEKHIELARKLKALAERGEGAEKENAEEKLRLAMKRYGITEADLEQESIDWHQVIIENALYRKLAEQVISTVLGMGFYISTPKGTPRHKPYVKCTWSEFIEIQAKIDFYTQVYKKARKEFELAFIFANELYAKPTENNNNHGLLSSDELEMRANASTLALGIKKHTFLKQLGSPENPEPDNNKTES